LWAGGGLAGEGVGGEGREVGGKGEVGVGFGKGDAPCVRLLARCSLPSGARWA